MQEQQQQQGGEGDAFGDADSLDDHQGFGEVDGTTQEIAKERMKETIKKAAEEAEKARNWGTVSSSMRQDVLERIATKIDWRKVLRYFVKTSQRSDKRSTPRRLNKRFPKVHPGKRVRRHAKIAISIDQSGSVDDGMLTAFFSELNKLAEIAEFTVIPFDTQVAEDKVYIWKKGQTRKTERVLTGGTCFDAPTKYVNDREFDGHIVLTDLMAPKPVASKCQRMWMTTKNYAARPYFSTNERIIAID
jgi:predicted metal-dependent peptidase